MRAIVKAIELSTSNCVLHHQHLIIESDSANIISWMHKPHNCHWKHHNIFSSVNRLNVYFGLITYSHIFRESNCMAKQEVRRSSEFVAWFWLNHQSCGPTYVSSTVMLLRLFLFCFVEENLAMSSFWWILLVLPGSISLFSSLCRAICYYLFFLLFIYLRLCFVFFMAFFHNMIFCSLCTNLARFWRLMI